MQANFDTEKTVIYRPNLPSIKASLVGSVMILTMVSGLSIMALYLFLFDDRPGAYFPVDLGILVFSLTVCASIAYMPLRRLRERRQLINDVKEGRYHLRMSPGGIVLKTASGEFSYLFRDFEFVGKDSLILGNKKDWGSLALVRRLPDKLTRKQRASIVRPTYKGHVDSGTYDGVTTIPLVYFGRDDFNEIVDTARSYHNDVLSAQ